MEVKKAKRKAIRGVFTKKYNEFIGLVENNEIIEDLSVSFTSLELVWEKLSVISEEISSQLDENEIDKDVVECLKYEDCFVTARAKLKCIKDSKVHKIEHVNRAGASNLPKLNITPFSGDVLLWSEFWELFDCNIHSNATLSTIEKFSYLRSYLRGKALNVIAGFQLSASNYDNAIEILKKRFGCTNKIVKAHVREILQMEPLKYTKNSQLRIFVDTLSIHIRALDALGLTQDKYGCFLFSIVLSRLPEFLKLQWARKDPDDSLDLSELIIFLESESNALEVTNEISNSRQNMTKQVCTLRENNKPLCFMCNDKHYLSECSNFRKLNLNEKLKFLDDKRLCHNCFGPNHTSSKCHKNFRCSECSGRHHYLLHSRDRQFNSEQFKKPILHINSETKEALLPSLYVFPVGSNVPLLALLDSGSQVTLLRKAALKKIMSYSLVKVQDLSLQGIGGPIQRMSSPKKVIFEVGGSRKVQLDPVLTDQLNVMIRVPDTDDSPSYCDTVDLIIGVDTLPRILTGKLRTSDYGISFETHCGWSKMGVCPPLPPSYSLAVTSSGPDNSMVPRQLYKVLELNECDEFEDGVSEHKLAVEHFDKTHRVVNSRFCVQWPILRDISNLLTCEKQCYSRFQNLLRRLKTDPILMQEYKEIFQQYISLGIIELVNRQDEPQGPVRYLPHHPVIKLKEGARKIRIVFDASSKDEDGISLNDIMLSGPPLNPEICELLIKFRMNEVGLIGDVEKAFLQLVIDFSQRDLTRFFWSDERGNIQTWRFQRVLFGAKGSPFLLAASIGQHLKTYNFWKETCDTLATNIYVDDVVTSHQSREEASQFLERAVIIMKEIGMNLSKWKANINLNNAECKSSGQTQVLGVTWDLDSDQLIFLPPLTQKKDLSSKRSILTFVASIWDPLGVFSGLTLSGRLLLRKLWELSLGWDDPLPVEAEKALDVFIDSVNSTKTIQLKRYLEIKWLDTITLHGFGDASKNGIAAIVYASSASENPNSKYVIARTKLTPAKPTTIPRLELLAAVLCAKLIKYVQDSFQFNCKVVCWTDSQVVLHWLNTPSLKLNGFIEKRTSIIKEIVAPESWRFIRSKENPADSLSRGETSIDFICPPDCIHKPYIPPDNLFLPETDSKIQPEEKKDVFSAPLSMDLIDTSRFSSFEKMVRAFAWALRFVNILKGKCVTKSRKLELDEIEEARHVLVKIVQQTEFSATLGDLQASRVNRNNTLAQLRPFLDDKNILRSDRRLSNSNLTYEEQFPIILPKNGRFVELLIADYHEQLLHSSVERTIVEIRNKFWIIHCRNIVKKVIFNCRRCKRYRAVPATEDMPPLPKERVSSDNGRAFAHVGVDFVGPLKFSTTENMKIYILLITCTRIRAIHLEVTTKIDENSCLNALRMFMSRRGIPNTIFSDNAQTFLKVSKTLERDYNIKWNFNTPYAPWQGGFYERLNRTVKEPLRFAIQKGRMDLDSIKSTVARIEAIVNSRPLTTVTDDINDEMILTPAHFLVGGSLVTKPSFHTRPYEERSLQLLWRGKQGQLKEFWETWRVRYLREIRQVSRKKSHNLNVGDIVIVSNEKRRNEWPLGKIEELKTGRDGKSRSALVRFKGKSKLRPVQHLYRLEEAT